MRKTRIFGQKFSVLGIGGDGGGSLPPKIINVPADYPTLIEANKNIGRHYYIGGDPSVTDNDPAKTDTGQTFLLGQDILWDGVSAYFAVGDNAIWTQDGTDVKTATPQNINLQTKGLKDANVSTSVKLGDTDNASLDTENKTLIGGTNEVNAKTNAAFDATVGLAVTGADYTLLQDAIDAGKYNLLIIGDYITAEPITLGADFVQITIAKSWTINEEVISIGAGGLKVQNGILIGIYTTLVTKIFTGSGTLQLHNVSVFTDSSTIANAGIADLTSGTKHIISNCTFKLSNTAECGFKNPGDGSSFTNLNVIGGGAACSGFIPNASKSIIDNINITGTVQDVTTFISASTVSCIINNIKFKGTNRPLIKLEVGGNQVNNINGDIEIDVNNTVNNQISNCYVADIDLTDSGAQLNKFSNCYVTTVNTTIAGVLNQFINFESDANLIVDGNANFFTHARCPDVTVNGNDNQFIGSSLTVYTDTGNDNAYISGISDDVLMTADSSRLGVTQHAAKTYSDNIAKGLTVDYFFSDTVDVSVPNYFMYPSDTGQVESSVAASITAPDTLIASWITEITEPNFTTLLAGIYDIHIHAAKTAGTKDVHIYFKFYRITHPGGVETLLATSDNSGNLTGSNVGYTLHDYLPNDEILADTDRLVIKAFGIPTGTGTDPTATLYLEGTNSSRMEIHTTTSAWLLNLKNIIYVNGAGSDSNDGLNMSKPKLTIASALTAAAAQSPTSTNIVVVKILGGLRYAEDVTVPAWVVLDMSDAISNGQVTVGVTMGADSFYYFNEAIMPSGKESVRCIGAGIRYIKGNFTTPETSSTFLNASGDATVYLDIINADAVKTGATFSTLTTGAVLFLKAQTFRETVASTSVGSTVFRNIADDGANADTTRINETGDQIIRGKDKVSLGTSIANIVLDLEGSYQKWTVNPHFIAYNDAQFTDVTGDNTLYTIPFNQVDENVGNHYNPTIGVFTAPTTGLYHFNIILFTKGFGGAHLDLNIRLLTTTANWYFIQLNPLNARGAGGDLILNGSIDVLMNSGNTARFQVQVGNSTKVIDVEIGSHCSGRLLTRKVSAQQKKRIISNGNKLIKPKKDAQGNDIIRGYFNWYEGYEDKK